MILMVKVKNIMILYYIINMKLRILFVSKKTIMSTIL